MGKNPLKILGKKNAPEVMQVVRFESARREIEAGSLLLGSRWRGSRIVRYDGERLRMVRKYKGVGRPPEVTLARAARDFEKMNDDLLPIATRFRAAVRCAPFYGTLYEADAQ